MEIREALSEEDKFAVYRLRYEVYVEELGRHEPYADHEKRILTDPHDNTARILGAWEGVKLIGTLRNNATCNPNYAASEEFQQDYVNYDVPSVLCAEDHCVSFSSKFMIHQEWRNSLGGLLLIKSNYRYVAQNGISFDFIDCQPDLMHFYRRFGYREYYSGEFQSPYYGIAYPMVASVRDREYFELIKSPLAKLCKSIVPAEILYEI